MSASFCIKCSKMVPAYEKYCTDCVRNFSVQQSPDFWKTNPDPARQWTGEEYDLWRREQFDADLLASTSKTFESIHPHNAISGKQKSIAELLVEMEHRQVWKKIEGNTPWWRKMWFPLYDLKRKLYSWYTQKVKPVITKLYNKLAKKDTRVIIDVPSTIGLDPFVNRVRATKKYFDGRQKAVGNRFLKPNKRIRNLYQLSKNRY